MEFPLAAGIQQAIRDQGFEHLEPGRAFLRVWQERLPKGIEIEAIPEFQSKPAAAPLAWTGQFDVIKAELDGGMFEAGVGRAVFGEEVDLAGASRSSMASIARVQPARSLSLISPR